MKFRNKHIRGDLIRSFILLEVIISMVIISVTVASILRSFSVSIRGTHNAEIATIATMLANELLQEFELQPPEEDQLGGDFQEDGFPFYYWEASIEEVEVDYPDLSLESEIEDFTNLTQITIDVYYDDGRRRPYRAVHLVSYLTGLEKFTYESKRANKLY